MGLVSPSPRGGICPRIVSVRSAPNAALASAGREVEVVLGGHEQTFRPRVHRLRCEAWSAESRLRLADEALFRLLAVLELRSSEADEVSQRWPHAHTHTVQTHRWSMGQDDYKVNVGDLIGPQCRTTAGKVPSGRGR